MGCKSARSLTCMHASQSLLPPLHPQQSLRCLTTTGCDASRIPEPTTPGGTMHDAASAIQWIARNADTALTVIGALPIADTPQTKVAIAAGKIGLGVINGA